MSEKSGMMRVNGMINEVADAMIVKMFKDFPVGNVGLTFHRHKKAYGCFYVDKNWKIGEDGFHEINISEHAIRAGKTQMFCTIAHELVHAANTQMGIKDTDKTLRRHNKKFKAGLEKVGMKAFDTGGPGGWDDVVEWYPVFEEIVAELSDDAKYVLENVDVLLQFKSGGSNTQNLSVFICPNCGQKARAKQGAKLICGNDCCLPDDTEGMVTMELVG